jgi:hypothetical protein
VSRPFYETESDRIAEKAIADRIAAKYGWTVVQLKPACHVDFALMNGDQIKGFMEIKNRKYDYEAMRRMGGLMLSAVKFSGLINWRDTYYMGIVVGLNLTDGLFTFTTLPNEPVAHFKMKFMGRIDRNDDQDMEPCILIPIEKFKRLE